jgi:hypothetical protein
VRTGKTDAANSKMTAYITSNRGTRTSSRDYLCDFFSTWDTVSECKLNAICSPSQVASGVSAPPSSFFPLVASVFVRAELYVGPPSAVVRNELSCLEGLPYAMNRFRYTRQPQLMRTVGFGGLVLEPGGVGS